MTMSALAKQDVQSWANEVVNQLHELFNLDKYNVIVLGLRKFAFPIAQQCPHSQAPLVGMNMPQALNFLRNLDL